MIGNVPRGLQDDRAAHLDGSRRAIHEAIDRAGHFTLVRSIGNLGDQLIAAGTRQLLAGFSYDEISIEEAVRSRGETAVLMGSGAWCEPFHEIMPAALTALEARYSRVIVLPSSFDVKVRAVRRALERSRAVIFARERESYAQIATICDARLAHDTAFFFDFAPYAVTGSGVLHAYRDDAEATGWSPVERDNRDISMTLGSLDEWLWTIARHAEVHTDRAHVMIAAAMLGKRVLIYPTTTHKVMAIAEYALADFDVHREGASAVTSLEALRVSATPTIDLRQRLLELGSESLRGIPDTEGEPRVTIVVLSWNRFERTQTCIESIASHVRMPFRLLVIDNGSELALRNELTTLCAPYDFAELRLLEANIGCGAARQLAASIAGTEYLAFVDDDAEVFPGAIEHLVRTLDEHPETRAVGARVVLPSGLLQFCGGDYRVHDGIIAFEPLARARAFDDPTVVSGQCLWVGGTAFACRRSLFLEFPLDPGMSAYFEDNEWCYRIEQQQPGSFRTAAEAFVLHHQETKERKGSAPNELLRAVDFVVPMAHFYMQHGLIQDDLFGFVSELTMPDGTRDIAAARLLLELVTAKGREWTALHWVTGALSPLFLRRPLTEVTSSRWFRLASAYWSLRRRAAAAIKRVVGS
jgi:GT2 family glycosyltransferase